MEVILEELLGISRDVYIFLTKEPTLEEQKVIVNKTLEVASYQHQPVVCRVNDIAFIRTENLSFKPTLIGRRMIGHLNLSRPYPKPLLNIYEALPILFLSSSKIDTSENGINVNFTIHVPFGSSEKTRETI